MTEQTSFNDNTWADFNARLRAYVRRRVDPASVDDVVAGVLLRLVKHRDDLAAARSPIAWALRVAANAVADHHRRHAVERGALAKMVQEDALRQVSTESLPPTPEDDLTRCLLPFIRALPPPYDEALMLTDIQGLTQGEAAARLGLSLSGMKSRVQRGRRKLKDALLRCCTVELDRRGGIIDYQRRDKDRCRRC